MEPAAQPTTAPPAGGGGSASCPAGEAAAPCGTTCAFGRVLCDGPFSLKALTSWENAVNSACALAGVNLVYFVLCCVFRISFVAVVAACLTGALGVGFISKSFTGQIPPFKDVTEEQAKERGAKIMFRINQHRRIMHDLVYWTNAPRSLGVFLSSLLSVCLLWRLPLGCFLWIGTNVMLTWKHISSFYKAHGARYVDRALSQVFECVNKIPRGGKHHRS